MAEILDVPLIRMQCYEGLDESKALYEWKYGKQLLYTQLLKDKLGEMMQGAVGLAASISGCMRTTTCSSPSIFGAAPALPGLAPGARLRAAGGRG